MKNQVTIMVPDGVVLKPTVQTEEIEVRPKFKGEAEVSGAVLRALAGSIQGNTRYVFVLPGQQCGQAVEGEWLTATLMDGIWVVEPRQWRD